MKNLQRILIFAKAPVNGHVKTRLAADMDPTDVVRLYRHFVLDIHHLIKASGLPYKIYYDPPDAEPFIAKPLMAEPLMAEWLGEDNDFILQRGKNLGERMKNAFIETFSAGIARVVIIGTDFPDLPVEFILNAFSGLKEKNSVIGPTRDGGYYLIGFNSDAFIPEVFSNMPWGSSAVLQKTMDRLNHKNCSVHVLPKWRDVDTAEDLKYLIRSLKKNPDTAPETSSFLKSRKMLDV